MTAIEEIAAERKRQIEVEGWTPAHDDKHGSGQLAKAAAAYAGGINPFNCKTVEHHYQFNGRAQAGDPDYFPVGEVKVPYAWPWEGKFWKPKTYREDLIRAAALIVAEIERLDRINP